MIDNYSFKGIKLTPNVFAALLVELFDGKQFSRKTAIETIVNHHKSNGGIVEPDRDVIAIFKKASQNLKKSEVGLINRGYGIWELHYEIKEVEEIVKDTEKRIVMAYKADEEYGQGENAVYVYYYDSYRELSELKDLTSWPCKIGRTDSDPIQRVMGQAGTCYPELPHIALIFKCDDSSVLEAAFHNVLKFQNKWLQNAPGSEWFMTSPEEIKHIYSIMSNGYDSTNCED